MTKDTHVTKAEREKDIRGFEDFEKLRRRAYRNLVIDGFFRGEWRNLRKEAWQKATILTLLYVNGPMTRDDLVEQTLLHAPSL